jgi:hypothetical protein
MSHEERQLRKIEEKLETAEAALEDEFEGALLNTPSGQQRRIFENLNRLYISLRGPETLLDRVNYSRPFPPKPPKREPSYDRERAYAQPGS